MTLGSRSAIDMGDLARLSNEWTLRVDDETMSAVTAEGARRQPGGGWLLPHRLILRRGPPHQPGAPCELQCRATAMGRPRRCRARAAWYAEQRAPHRAVARGFMSANVHPNTVGTLHCGRSEPSRIARPWTLDSDSARLSGRRHITGGAGRFPCSIRARARPHPSQADVGWREGCLATLDSR